MRGGRWQLPPRARSLSVRSPPAAASAGSRPATAAAMADLDVSACFRFDHDDWRRLTSPLAIFYYASVGWLLLALCMGLLVFVLVPLTAVFNIFQQDGSLQRYRQPLHQVFGSIGTSLFRHSATVGYVQIPD